MVQLPIQLHVNIYGMYVCRRTCEALDLCQAPETDTVERDHCTALPLGRAAPKHDSNGQFLSGMG